MKWLGSQFASMYWTTNLHPKDEVLFRKKQGPYIFDKTGFPVENKLSVYLWKIIGSTKSVTRVYLGATVNKEMEQLPQVYTDAFTVLVHTNIFTLQLRHNRPDGVSNHRHLNWLFNRLFRRRSKKTSKLRVTALCEGNSPVTGEFPSQRASNAENVSISWRHHDYQPYKYNINCQNQPDIGPVTMATFWGVKQCSECKCQRFSNQRQLDCLFNNLLRLTTKKTQNAH